MCWIIRGLAIFESSTYFTVECLGQRLLQYWANGSLGHLHPAAERQALGKPLWRAPSLQPNILPRHSPTVSCFLALHIEKVSGIFPVALTQVAEAKKNPTFGRSKEQCSPARIVSGAGSLKSPGSLKSGIGEGWGMFFSKAASKGLPMPFTRQAGWRCSHALEKQRSETLQDSISVYGHTSGNNCSCLTSFLWEADSLNAQQLLVLDILPVGSRFTSRAVPKASSWLPGRLMSTTTLRKWTWKK